MSAPLKPSFMTHRNHSQTFGAASDDDPETVHGEQTNIVCQAWLTNIALESDPPALIKQRVEWARTPVEILLRRLQGASMSSVTNEEIQLIKNRSKALSDDREDLVSQNGISDLECQGLRFWTSGVGDGSHDGSVEDNHGEGGEEDYEMGTR